MHMAHWSNIDDFQDDSTSRVLSLVTGNVQTLPTTAKHEYAEDDFSVCETETSRPSYLEQPRTSFPAGFTSGGHHDINRRNHAFRRLRRRLELSIRYQNRPEYRRYRERLRKDTDKQGKTIWTSEMEEAFSNALVNIPPMGRRKKSQHGKSFGRNELIREWMLQETGVLRKRKQISSHIQVLDNVFKDFPDWKRLTKISSASAALEPELYDYYNDSVADRVRNWPALKRLLMDSTSPNQKALMIPTILKSNDSFSDRHPLNRLEFEMWVGPSGNVNRCLHRYTKTAEHDTSFGKANHPLEDIEDWKFRFPDMEAIIADISTTGNCDIVLLDTSFQLMADFPLEQVKLGINFQLDFFDAECGGVHELDCLSTFSCITRMYQGGKFIRQTEADSCQVVGRGRVKPPFESRWWAHEFVRLTDIHRMAEDSGKESDVAAAMESTKDFLGGLTVIQQIYTGLNESHIHQSGTAPISTRQRAAVLLWVFSQAKPGWKATTVPRKLVLPPIRTATNSLLSPTGATGLPFLIDTHVNTSSNGIPVISDNMEAYVSPSLPPEPPEVSSGSDMEELCQDGFMIAAHQNPSNGKAEFDSSLGVYDHGVSHRNALHDLQQPSLYTTGKNPIMDTSQYCGVEYFGSQDMDVKQSFHENDAVFQIMQLGAGGLDENSSKNMRSPLERFDSGTHQSLQAQLGNIGLDHESDGGAKYGYPEVLQSYGSLEEPCNLHTRLTGSSEKAFKTDNSDVLASDSLWDNFDLTTNLSRATNLHIRPSMQHCHSFTGIVHTQDNTFDTPRRSFTRLLEQMEMNQGTSYVPQSVLTGMDSGHLERSQSQPPPEVRADHTDSQFHSVGLMDSWADVKFEDIT